jgi:hypothetical protein
MADEHTPLLASRATNFWDFSDNHEDDLHSQFCKLVGCPPSNLPADTDHEPVNPTSLYGRALRQRSYQQVTYYFTAGLTNVLLLSQVVLGAALTGLGASRSDPVLVTVFGALNTIIAGIVAYLKSRGQPMRARMYRDDLERVVDEIENSEIMWRGRFLLVGRMVTGLKAKTENPTGISRNMHGYSRIDIDDEVTVRGEVARLSRLYDRAVRNNTNNNPDMYMSGAYEGGGAALRQPAAAGATPAAPVPDPSPAAPPVEVPAVAAAPVIDPDVSPATAPPKVDEPKEDKSKDGASNGGESSKSAEASKPKEDAKPAPVRELHDPDASPATTDPKPTSEAKKPVEESDVESKPAPVEGSTE